MTLEELGKEYNKAYFNLINKTKNLKKNLNNFSGNEKIVQQRRILSLYTDALYCKKIYEKLVNYYKK